MKPEPLRYEAGVLSVDSDVRLLHIALLSTLMSPARRANKSAPVSDHDRYLWKTQISDQGNR